MEKHKRVGLLTMAISMILVVALIIFSESLCYAGTPPAESLVTWLLVCLRINVYEEIPGNQFADHIYLQTKYFLLPCVALFLLGAWWYLGALPVPSKAKNATTRSAQVSASVR